MGFFIWDKFTITFLCYLYKNQALMKSKILHFLENNAGWAGVIFVVLWLYFLGSLFKP